jgi:hypothetical protein
MKSEELDAAFRATTYRVEAGDGFFDLRIGVRNPAFDEYLRQRCICSWAVITAFNPGAVRGDLNNQQRQMNLQEELQSYAWVFLKANNIADSGDWPDEPSFLVLNASVKEMLEMASKYYQSAFVYGSTDSEPSLVWI